MATKTITSSEKNGYKVSLTVTSGTQSTSGNYTNVTYTVKLLTTYATFYGYTIGYQVKINGKQVAYHDNSGDKVPQGAMTKGEPYEVRSGSTKVYHSDNGKAEDIALYVKIWTDETSYTPGTLSKSGTMDLPTIARKSTPTFTPSTVQTGGILTVKTNRLSSDYTHTLTLSLAGETLTKSNIGTSATFSIPDSWAGLITTSENASATLTCKTYSGDSLIGTATGNVPIKVNSSIVPTCTVQFIPQYTNNLLEGYGKYLQGFTQAKVTSIDIDYPASSDGNVYSVDIASYTLLYDGVETTFTNVEDIVSPVLLKAGSQSVQVSVTDTRGRTSSYHTTVINAIEYRTPYLDGMTIYRSDADNNPADDGEYITVFANVKGTELDGRNALTLEARYITHEGTYGESWTTIASGTKTILGTASLSLSYDVQLKATDLLAGESFYEAFVPTEKVAIRVVRSGDTFRIGFGKPPEFPGMEVDMDAQINGGLSSLNANIAGSLMTKGFELVNPVLMWEGLLYMNSTHTATYEDGHTVSQQPHGIVLVWSRYDSGASNQYWHTTFVPRWFVDKHNANGYSDMMVGTPRAGHLFGSKYVYIGDTKITGYAGNAEDFANTDSGINISNKSFVLRYVIGV